MKDINKLTKFFDKELALAHAYIKKGNEEDYLNVIKTIRQIKSAKIKLGLKPSYYEEMENYINLTNLKIDNNFIDGVKQLIDMYANRNNLICESLKENYCLSTISNISLDNITKFINYIYNCEFNNKVDYFNSNNIVLYNNSFLGKQLNSNYTIYHNFYMKFSKLFIVKNDNVKDLIYSCAYAYELLDSVEFTKYNNISNIIFYYMRTKAINNLRDKFNEDINKLETYINDRLIKCSKKIKICIDNDWDSLSKNEQAMIFNFVDEIIGMYIANSNYMDLPSLIDLIDTKDNLFVLFNQIKDDILVSTKKMVKKRIDMN